METTETPKRKEQPFIGFLMMAGLLCWLLIIFTAPVVLIPVIIGIAILYFKKKPLHRAIIPAFAIFPLPFVCVALLFVHFYNPTASTSQQANTEKTAPPPAEKVNMGQVLHTRYFDVTVNNGRITDRVSVGNEYLDLPRDAGNNYLILNITFRNTDNESRMLSEGAVIINYNGKDYLFLYCPRKKIGEAEAAPFL